jgi:glycosyltransferase involved in cell wall biosynthesis
MKKRIAFLISDQHLIPHGGIGQFAKGFCEMAERNDCVVDLILDTEPRNVFFELKGKVVFPKNSHSLKDHRDAFAFSDSYNLERAVNFRNAMMSAFQTNIYDLIVINTPEAYLGVYPLDMARHIPMVFYTHNENLVFRDEAFKGVFNPTFDSFFIAAMKADDLIIGTQTDRNTEELEAAGCSVLTLPMPMPERGLLEPWTGEKSGLLFIGRWEERKNPQEFLKVAAATKLPVKVMTAQKSVKKWQAELDKLGLEHDVRGGITGQEKVDFIRSSKVFYMPSKSESYGFSLFEAAGHCHCVVLEQYGWTKNWDPSLFYKVSQKGAAELLGELYSRDVPETNLATVKSIDLDTWTPWALLMDDFEAPESKSSAAKVASADDFYVEDFIKDLKRFASTEDIHSILTNRSKFQITYTEKGTWMSREGNPPASESDLFSW